MKDSYFSGIALLPSSVMKENNWCSICFLSTLRKYSLLGCASVFGENYISCNLLWLYKETNNKFICPSRGGWFVCLF